MKKTISSVIFYFSQVVTGNTKKIAEKIAEGLRSGGNECDLVRLTKYQEDIKLFKTFSFEKYDLIGFGVPVYYFHPPYHITFELEYLPSLQNKKGFIFCTSGGNAGSTLFQLSKILKKKELKIIDGEDKWIGWDVHQMYSNLSNSNGHYGWLPTSYEHPNERELKSAENFGMELIKKTLDPDITEKNDFWEKENVSAKMWSFKGIQDWFPEFNLIEEKCNQCGICAQLCPWDAILLDPFPKWVRECNRCYICDLKCPQNAIFCNFSKQIAYLEGLMKTRKNTNIES